MNFEEIKPDENMTQQKYEQFLAEEKRRISDASNRQFVEGIWDVIIQLLDELMEEIFRGKEKPQWIHIILNIARFVAKVVALILAMQTARKAKL